MQNLTHWSNRFTSLKQGGTPSGKAPHKPVLLLSLIDLVEDLGLTENRIPIDNSLFERFKTNWALLVTTPNKCDITYPIIRLQNDGFWKVINRDLSPLTKKPSSENQILKKISFGKFDDGLWQFLNQSNLRPLLRMVILDFYFQESKEKYLSERPAPSYIQEFELEVMGEEQAEYRSLLKQEQGFVRDWKFRNAVLRAYDFTCCISKLSFNPPQPIIEACHIQTFADTGNNHITNGIPLCTNLHRAFDAGILSLNDNLEVLVKSKMEFEERYNSPYSIRQFEGGKIILPKNTSLYPSLEKLKWHRSFHGF